MNYILDLLETDGSHYLAVRLVTPNYCLHIPDGNYKVRIDIQNHVVMAQILIERQTRKINRQVHGNLDKLEQFADRKGRYCYTLATIYIPIRRGTPEIYNNIDTLSDYVRRNDSLFREQALLAFNKLLEVYRLYTGECHILPLAGRDTLFDHTIAVFFDQSPPDAKKPDFIGEVTPFYDIHYSLPVVPQIPQTIEQSIREKLKTDFQTKLGDELLLNAHNFLDQGNYRLTVIEAETAFEAALYDFLATSYKGTRLTNYDSPTKLIKDSKFQSAITAKGKVFNKNDYRYKAWDNNVWRVRSKIVHGKITNVQYSIAHKAIQIIEDNLEYLFDRPRTTPWKYTY